MYDISLTLSLPLSLPPPPLTCKGLLWWIVNKMYKISSSRDSRGSFKVSRRGSLGPRHHTRSWGRLVECWDLHREVQQKYYATQYNPGIHGWAMKFNCCTSACYMYVCTVEDAGSPTWMSPQCVCVCVSKLLCDGLWLKTFGQPLPAFHHERVNYPTHYYAHRYTCMQRLCV